MTTPQLDWNAAFAAHRARLVQRYTRLTGSADVADDLAQETLIEAWRSLHKLQDSAGLPQWLNAIAQHIYLRWRRQAAVNARYVAPPVDDDVMEANPPDALTLLEEPALSLERVDLALLLEHALALLPRQSRYLVMASYMRELPQAEVAAQVGLSASALRVRLHRARAKLRELLEPALADDAATDLSAPTTATTELPRWCPFCGKRRVIAHYVDGGLIFRCSGPCLYQPGILGSTNARQRIDPAVALDELLQSCDVFYRAGLRSGAVTCPSCGREIAMLTKPPSGMEDWSLLQERHHHYILCPCGYQDVTPLWHITLDLPALRHFWQEHPQIHAIPEHSLDYQGRPALRTGFASLTDAARADVICDATTYEPLALYLRGVGTQSAGG